MRPHRLITLLAGLLLAAAAHARSGHENVAFDPAAFAEQHSRLVKEIQSGSRYAEIGREQRRDVLSKLEQLGEILLDVSSLNQLDGDSRVRLYNLQEEVNTILTRAAEDSRMICKRETKTGSHRMETRCRTVAQMRIAREDSQNDMRDVMRAKLPEIEAQPTYNRGGGN